MKLFYCFIWFCIPLLNTDALGVSQMGWKIEKARGPSPIKNLESNKVLGVRVGHKYTSQAELEGCERTVSASAPRPGRLIAFSENAHSLILIQWLVVFGVERLASISCSK